MAGQPKTRAKKAVLEERRAERAANGGKRTVRKPTPPKKVAAKKQAAEEASANGEELDFAGFTTATWEVWIAEFVKTGRQDKACKVSGIPRQTVYKRTRQDVEFGKLVQEVRDMTMDSLEDEAIRRARDGWNEPQYFKGELQGYVRKYDSGLLTFMLTNGRPDKYRPKKEAEQGSGGGPAAAPIINLTLNRVHKKAD